MRKKRTCHGIIKKIDCARANNVVQMAVLGHLEVDWTKCKHFEQLCQESGVSKTNVHRNVTLRLCHHYKINLSQELDGDDDHRLQF